MSRPQHALVSMTLRIPRTYPDQIVLAAKRHAATVATEIRLRLEDSFVVTDHRALSAMIRDMDVVWARYSWRFGLAELEDDFIKALVQTTDPEVRKHARAWLAARRISPEGGLWESEL